MSVLDVEADYGRLLFVMGACILVAAVLMVSTSWTLERTMRTAPLIAGFVGLAVAASAKAGRVRLSAWILCMGLMLVACTGVNNFGIRSTAALVFPLAITCGAWLLGRKHAVAMASVASLQIVWEYVGYLRGVMRPSLQYVHGDFVAFVAVFMVTAILGGAMANAFRRQLISVKQMAADLQQSNATLETRVAERSAKVLQMQQQVMDAEKLTSLGSMVAGISHELNTPLGNALTVSTTLEAQVHTVALDVADGKLTRTALADFLQLAEEMARLNTQSITRAADLVASFKQVAVDQTSEQRRPFMLDRVVHDNVAALRPSVAKSAIVIDVQIAADIACDSYPGPLGQVVTNLVQNAFVHGYAGRAQGSIRVLARTQAESVVLEVADDGCGMEPAVLAHVFEPFFTTRLGKGGSGLGLSVSLRIAQSVLGGSLTAQSEPGKGTTFSLAFPKRAPGAL